MRWIYLPLMESQIAAPRSPNISSSTERVQGIGIADRPSNLDISRVNFHPSAGFQIPTNESRTFIAYGNDTLSKEHTGRPPFDTMASTTTRYMQCNPRFPRRGSSDNAATEVRHKMYFNEPSPGTGRTSSLLSTSDADSFYQHSRSVSLGAPSFSRSQVLRFSHRLARLAAMRHSSHAIWGKMKPRPWYHDWRTSNRDQMISTLSLRRAPPNKHRPRCCCNRWDIVHEIRYMVLRRAIAEGSRFRRLACKAIGSVGHQTGCSSLAAKISQMVRCNLQWQIR